MVSPRKYKSENLIQAIQDCKQEDVDEDWIKIADPIKEVLIGKSLNAWSIMRIFGSLLAHLFYDLGISREDLRRFISDEYDLIVEDRKKKSKPTKKNDDER